MIWSICENSLPIKRARKLSFSPILLIRLTLSKEKTKQKISRANPPACWNCWKITLFKGFQVAIDLRLRSLGMSVKRRAFGEANQPSVSPSISQAKSLTKKVSYLRFEARFSCQTRNVWIKRYTTLLMTFSDS